MKYFIITAGLVLVCVGFYLPPQDHMATILVILGGGLLGYHIANFLEGHET